MRSTMKANHQYQISKFVQDLCERAPSMAQHLVQEILKHLANRSQPEAQVSKARGSSTNFQKSSKKRIQKDRPYQPPKPPAKQPTTCRDEAEDLDAVVKCRSMVGDDLVTDQPGHYNKSINQSANSRITDTRPLPECEEEISETVENVPQEGVQDQSTIDNSAPYQPNLEKMSIDQSSSSLETEKTQPLQKCEEDIPITVVEKVPQGGVQGQPVTSSNNTSTEIAPDLPKPTPSSNSAIGDEVHGQSSVAIDDSTENSQTACLPSLPGEVEQRETALPEIDGQASEAQAICSPQNTELHETTLSAPPPSTPVRQINRRLQSPFSDDQTVTPNTTIFTPTVSREVLSPPTEDDRTASPLERADLALPRGIQSPLSSTGQQLTKLSNAAPTQTQQVNREQLLPVQDRETTVPSSSTGEVPTICDMVAKTIQIIHTMSNRQELPSEAHSKILSTLRPSLDTTLTVPAVAERVIPSTSSSTSWSPSMWINMLEAAEAHSREAIILNMIERMGASKWYDAEHAEAEKEPPLTKKGRSRKRLASVELLVETGQSDLSRFFDSLESQAIITSEEISSLRAKYGRERGYLDTTVNRIIERISHVLAALEITDRPVFTKFGLSIPLYNKDTNVSYTIIYRKIKLTLTRRLIEEEFKYLNFRYAKILV
ncbi:hypothetical protein BJ875DRAFT_447053 [Amylocarpus encephaloides]|uniref:Uncharacterized protein n=1 Tax=Amylocarpus encephaloides TaxID=45428 RepID=A0A9P7Y7U3_9HELO|nr:hypothetical protein BJ875DRAFT_447053 [Amylocarpus encephaloides]